ncbi:MAG TPA: DNA gyrase subunit A [Saprospiraceae bacterium]|nr:DNA gyrase subunit A [Saprospiraceae bacterium]MCC6689772.1 DNA gyrase subunit A [Saprospiraceae bacterium]HMV23248.1 DNA gyrase subunit A [Saprospiraceae bacterium]HMZ72802.1 DNA gyrase subunit A [Saprospiraceae bacterium]HNE65623.1 DNA gyrase subunit A [Saprospiraceae bacterium]
MSENQKIIPVNIEEQMKSAYIDYSMSVIVARALPDVRDGLKPVHRRVLFGMSELGMSHTKPYKKSARIVGEVLGKYHPHGDSSVYDAMIRMAQEWSLRYPLVEGQGNFGSVDGDSPAAMRYTEARLQRISDEMLNDLDKETVDFALNFDDSLEEPTVLPTKFPNLLVNGATGIAVGMATNMLPHNLTEVVDGILATMDNPDITTEGLMEHIKGPDFPTGGIIYGIKGVKEAFETGRGRVVVRGRAEIETSEQGRESIIITEIPYQVNKANLVIKIAELVNEKKIEGISDIRDESDRKGMRIVVDVKRDAMANVILSKLYKFTPLQSYFGVNNIALVRGRPVVLNLKNLITEFVKFRLEVIVRRTRYELRKAEERAHILEGLLIALDHLDEVITLIRNSQTVEEAKDGLMSRFGLSEIQAKAILEMRLQRLTGLERDKIKNEYDELLKTIERLKAILASEALQMDIIREELTEIKNKFGDKRKTEITFDDADISIEDMIEDESVVISISHLGYIKRTKATEYKTQGRGGRGAMGSRTRDQDFVDQIFVASNHDYILFFTEQGKCYWLRVYELPETSRTSAGRVVQNLMNIDKDDKIKAYIVVKDLQNTDFINSHYIVFATRKGVIKKTILEAFSRPRANGINAITINEGDELLDAKLTTGNSEILMAIKSGRAIRFPERTVRPMGRSATGVRGVSLADDNDKVVGLICVDPEDATQTILVVSENGFGKRSLLEDYRITNRGGKGVKTINVTEKTGELVTIKVISDEDDLMITNRSGILIRIAASGLRVMGRATQGVKLIRIEDGDSISDIAVVKHEPEEETGESDNSTLDNDVTTDTDNDSSTENADE